MDNSHIYRILYFSGTGNTEWVMQRLSEALEAAGARSTMLACDQLLADCGMGPRTVTDPSRIRRELVDFLDGATHLLLGYPVYESTIPMPMRIVMDYLPDGRSRKLGVVCTYMMAGGDCCHLPEKDLGERGYDSVLATYVKMPNNINLPPVKFLHVPQGEELDAIAETATAAVDEIASWLANDGRHVEGRGIADYLLGVSQRWGEEMATNYVQDNIFALARCNRCRLCVDTCPMGNIGFDDGYPEFGDRCCDCLRCYHKCPQQAIQITDKTMDLERYTRYDGMGGWKAPRVRKVRKRRKGTVSP